MKIYVVGSSKNNFLPLDNIREKFLVDEKHEGFNIDFLNRWYCELTGLFYLWKHCEDDVIGLEHYRRYFVNDNGKILSETEINDILKNNDVICKKWVFSEHKEVNGLSFWNRSRQLSYLTKFLNCIEDKKLKDFINNKLKTQSYFCQCNMCIGKKEILFDYFDWLFNTLSFLKTEDFYSNPRICGYLSEFVFGFWLQYHNVKIKFCKTKVYDKTLKHIIVNG